MHSAPRRTLLLASLTAGLSAALSLPVYADTYPSKPITLVVTQGPGSGSDVMARLLANYLGPAIGQTPVCASSDGDSVGRQRLVGASDILCLIGVMKRDFHGAPGRSDP